MSQIPKVAALLFMKHHSERVPRKNIREFCGIPLFHWIVKSLEKSSLISEIIINTDSEEIAQNASENFDVTIHMRPDYLLDINSNEANQIIEYDLSKTDHEYFLQTHSTNPVLSTETIDSAIHAFFESKDNDCLISVTSVQKRFYWPNGEPINHDPHNMVKTQFLTPVYEENSCIYMFSKSGFMSKKDRVGNNPLYFPIDQTEAVDIDQEDDFKIAESIKKYFLEKG